MKRFSQSGSSPSPKHLIVNTSSESDNDECHFPSLSDDDDEFNFPSFSTSPPSSQQLHFNFPCLSDDNAEFNFPSLSISPPSSQQGLNFSIGSSSVQSNSQPWMNELPFSGVSASESDSLQGMSSK